MHSVGIRPTLLFLGTYLVAVYAGRQTVLEQTGLAMFSPAAGIAALWMLRGRSWVEVRIDAGVLFLATVALYLVLDLPAAVALFLSLAGVVQAWVVRVVLAHLQRVPLGGPVRLDLDSVQALTRLVAASVTAAFLGSPFGWIAGYLTTGRLSGDVQVAWVVRNSCGIFVVTAAFLALGTCLRARRAARPGRSLLTGERRPHAYAELALASVVSGILALAVFGPGRELPLTFLLIASSVWFGFRFTPAVGTLHALAVGVIVIVFTLWGWGPFGALEDSNVQAVVSQLYLGLTTLMVLLLSLGVSERQSLAVRIRASEAEATGRADLLDAITRAMSEGLLVVTGSGRVTLSNPAAAALATPDDSGIARIALHELRTPDGTPVHAATAPHVRALRGEQVPPGDLVHRDPLTGAEHVLAVTTAPLAAQDGESPDAAVMVIRDVTRERERERELQAYAGVVAHDLRAPLGALKSWSEILDLQLDDLGVDVSTPRTSLIRIFGTADRMQELIRDLLDYAQAQSTEVHPQRIDLGRLVTEVGGDLADATRAGLDRPVVTHGHLDDVVADPTLTRQLVANLIGNAVKYVAPGTVPHVRVHTVRHGAWVEVRVSDNGIGIPDEARGRVFDSFVRASSGSYTGTGLGLSICAKTVERHGGRIYATSGPGGQGTTMVFTLPAADDSDPQLPTSEAQREERTTSADPPPRRTGSATAVS